MEKKEQCKKCHFFKEVNQDDIPDFTKTIINCLNRDDLKIGVCSFVTSADIYVLESFRCSRFLNEEAIN